uniref:Uncharacterized protein n=1 Tax=Heterorhabditis bacteriophora TaxID=37862 RepID=A0A1I7XAG0_HETBA
MFHLATTKSVSHLGSERKRIVTLPVTDLSQFCLGRRMQNVIEFLLWYSCSQLIFTKSSTIAYELIGRTFAGLTKAAGTIRENIYTNYVERISLLTEQRHNYEIEEKWISRRG